MDRLGIPLSKSVDQVAIFLFFFPRSKIMYREREREKEKRIKVWFSSSPPTQPTPFHTVFTLAVTFPPHCERVAERHANRKIEIGKWCRILWIWDIGECHTCRQESCIVLFTEYSRSRLLLPPPPPLKKIGLYTSGQMSTCKVTCWLHSLPRLKRIKVWTSFLLKFFKHHIRKSFKEQAERDCYRPCIALWVWRL